MPEEFDVGAVEGFTNEEDKVEEPQAPEMDPNLLVDAILNNEEALAKLANAIAPLLAPIGEEAPEGEIEE